MFNLEIEFNQTCRAIKLYIYLFPKATHPNKKDKKYKKEYPAVRCIFKSNHVR